MPSQPLDPGWDFSSVIDLIESNAHDSGSPTLRPATTLPLASVVHDGGVHLGSFAKLYEHLGFSSNVSLPPLDPESELSNSDEALLPSPICAATQAPAKYTDNADEQPMNNTGLNKNQRKKARRRAEKEQDEQNRQRVVQETMEQISEEREQRASLRKQLENLANTSTKSKDVAETPCKPSRALSRFNASAKMRSTSPSPVIVVDTPEAPRTHQKPPKSPKTPKGPRPSKLKRSSTAQPVTPGPAQQTPFVPFTQPAPSQEQLTTVGTPAPFLYPVTSQSVVQLQLLQATTLAGTQGLVPRTVRPVTVPRSSQPVVVEQPLTSPTTPKRRRPGLTIRSQVDRHFHFFNKLLSTFPDDRRWLVSPMQLLGERTSAHGLHVFVDASNIMIGFKEMLRNHGIQPHKYELSFDSLALLMERRRPVAKKVFAGSHREANPLPQVAKLVETSRAVGYDSVMQEQVLIVREDSETKRFFNDVKRMGWHRATQLRSGTGSDSETGPPPTPKIPSAPKWVEQGVDEILHLKMCQSIIDTEVPSTMVLATGDGAIAEMSDGFLAHVERALNRGWKVELISWGKQTNGGYKNKTFRAQWAEQFRIIELDEFLEDIIDTP
ncbi:hypothetical protein EJ02DRAFT_451363 [Clathrospora elynae]|uniref:NYN domain-containing protein n=1 Tax=Clathrospora elynae TaxID=706981 RepID=A0A6A5T1U4_9PLEO|nr:hypothetical protein EJ02DRAFT_451363 [Clathrospora elynae]